MGRFQKAGAAAWCGAAAVAAFAALTLVATGTAANSIGSCGATAQNDNIILTNESDLACDGLAGDDNIAALAGDDTIRGNVGNDRLDGGDGTDNLQGGAGNDNLAGGPGHDAGGFSGIPIVACFGVCDIEGGNDNLAGGPGNDYVIAQYGADKVAGEGGDDLVWSIDGEPNDRVSCGPGFDEAWFDLGDVVTPDCEVLIPF